MNFDSIKDINVTIENYIDKNYEDDNCDVIVMFNNGDRYIASFFTFKNIDTLRKKFLESGECLKGKYFWSSDMFLIDNLKTDNVKSVVKHLIENNEFQSVFKKIIDNNTNDSNYNFIDPVEKLITMNNKIELAKFIHKFEVDLDYRRYLSENHQNKLIIETSYDIACNSIDWVYFPKKQISKYSDISNKAYKETPDHFLCIEMIEIVNENIDDNYADLILNSTNDLKLTDKYIFLMNLINKKFKTV